LAPSVADAPSDPGWHLLSIREVAVACQLSEKAVRRAIDDGELPAVKLRSRLRVTPEDFQAWIASSRRQRATDPTSTPARPKAGACRYVPRADAIGARAMSIEKVQRANGTVWRVRWRDPQGRPRSRVVGKRGDAQAMDAELKRSKRLGETALAANRRETLAEFAELWWRRHAAPNLERNTRTHYASMLDIHIIPRLGDVRLQSLSPELVGDLRAEMAAAGVGNPTIRKTLTLLQSILERAVEWRHLDSNPARGIRKPSQRRTSVVRPLAPQTVEAIRAYLLGHDLGLDATLVSVLAYAGLRPGEALGLRWHDVGERTLLVERSVAFGQLKSTKTGKTRTVRLLPPLVEDLAAWHDTTARPGPTDLIFPAPDGAPWNHDRAKNWRNRTFAEAAEAAGVPKARPYEYADLLVMPMFGRKSSQIGLIAA
jgi:excisionase family DNA binding protein